MEQELKQIEKVYDLLTNFVVNYSFQVIGAILILFVGFIVAKWLSGLVAKLLLKKNVDVTLSHFLANIIKIVVLALFIIISLGKFGISVSPFVAAIGAVAFGASLAIQGPVSNYGAGIAIIFTRMFVVGDTLKIHDYDGVVHEIKLASTTLKTEDGEHIIIPNKKIVGEVLINSFESKVVEAGVGIAYDTSPEQAIKVIREVLEQHEDVVKDPTPQVGIAGFGDSSVDLGIRYWVPTQKYFKVQYDINLKIFSSLKSHNITIPFPQREVRMLS